MELGEPVCGVRVHSYSDKGRLITGDSYYTRYVDDDQPLVCGHDLWYGLLPTLSKAAKLPFTKIAFRHEMAVRRGSG